MHFESQRNNGGSRFPKEVFFTPDQEAWLNRYPFHTYEIADKVSSLGLTGTEAQRAIRKVSVRLSREVEPHIEAAGGDRPQGDLADVGITIWKIRNRLPELLESTD